eukprot:1148663-Pelagomonas_calceolata.AAC.10
MPKGMVHGGQRAVAHECSHLLAQVQERGTTENWAYDAGSAGSSHTCMPAHVSFASRARK